MLKSVDFYHNDKPGALLSGKTAKQISKTDDTNANSHPLPLPSQHHDKLNMLEAGQGLHKLQKFPLAIIFFPHQCAVIIVTASLRHCKYFETRPFKCLAVLQFHVSHTCTNTSTASALVEILVVSLTFVWWQ